MDRLFRHIRVQYHGDVFCVAPRECRLDEPALSAMTEEIINLIENYGCRKLIFSLGKDSLDCLYSLLLGKLLTIQRHIQLHEGVMKLCDATPEVYSAFEVCQLHNIFDFVPDQASGLKAFASVTN
jgi:anti-anti-sigma regulatory factor